METNAPSLLDKFSNAGPVDKTPIPVVLPDTPKKKKRKHDPLVGVVAALNANRDLNTTHDFDYFILRDADLMDESAFNDIHRKVLANRQQFNNFSGDPKVDFTNLTPAEIQYYSDFLGINFKKIFHNVGHGLESVAHVVRDGAVDVAHAGRSVALDVAHAGRKAAIDVAHTGRSAALHFAHNARTLEQNQIKHLQQQAKATGNFLKKDWRYVADAAVIAGAIALAATGVGIPLAAALLTGGLSAINSIPYPQPELPPGFGSGGGMSMGDMGGSGFPEGSVDPDDNGDTGDTGEGLTFQDQQNYQAQQQAADQQEMAAQTAAEHKKKIMLWGGAIIAVIVVYWFFIRK